jgi:hypothetical protein
VPHDSQQGRMGRGLVGLVRRQGGLAGPATRRGAGTRPRHGHHAQGTHGGVASIEKWSDEVECGGRLGTSKGEATRQARVEEWGLTDRVQQRQGRNVGSTAEPLRHRRTPVVSGSIWADLTHGWGEDELSKPGIGEERHEEGPSPVMVVAAASSHDSGVGKGSPVIELGQEGSGRGEKSLGRARSED